MKQSWMIWNSLCMKKWMSWGICFGIVCWPNSKHKMETFWKQNPKYHPLSAPVSIILLNPGSVLYLPGIDPYLRHHVDIKVKGLVSTLLNASWAKALLGDDRCFLNGTLCEPFFLFFFYYGTQSKKMLWHWWAIISLPTFFFVSSNLYFFSFNLQNVIRYNTNIQKFFADTVYGHNALSN